MSDAPATKELVVRMPADLHAAVKADSEANERHIAGTIRLALRQYLARQQHEAKP